jgi:hypothetical protein
MSAANVFNRINQGHHAASNRCCSGSAIGLQDITINGDLALTELLQIHRMLATIGQLVAESLGSGRSADRAPLHDQLRVCVEPGNIPYSAVTHP